MLPSLAISSFMTEATWETIQPNKSAAFSYQALLDAADRVQGICSGMSWKYNQIDGCKIEMATFLAHVAYETNNFNSTTNETVFS
jgi:hypothetical protein